MTDTINQLDMAGVESIREHFSLTPLQVQQFTALGELYREWNAKINVISRKDIDNLYPHHILHSLAIAKVLHFQPGTTLLVRVEAFQVFPWPYYFLNANSRSSIVLARKCAWPQK